MFNGLGLEDRVAQCWVLVVLPRKQEKEKVQRVVLHCLVSSCGGTKKELRALEMTHESCLMARCCGRGRQEGKEV